MQSETVTPAEVRIGDTIQDPYGSDSWRTITDLGYDTQERHDQTLTPWKIYAFIGPLVDPHADLGIVTNQTTSDRFIFREDQPVTRVSAD